jgi:hypothetical protein
LRHESKYVLAAARQEAALAWLDHHCAADAVFRHNLIFSLYYDTPDLTLFGRKQDSDYLKWKVRVRWYAAADTPEFSAAAFLEVKSKEGALSRKVRVKLAIRGVELDRDPFSLGSGLPLTDLLEDQPWPRGRPLVPVCVIRYRRHRYVEMASGHRVALDTDIVADRVNPGMPLHPMLRPLDQAVVELKGPGAQALPPALLGLQAATGMRKDAFSKYGQCVTQIAT